MKNIKRGVYQVKDQDGKIMYIGSTTKWTVNGLEENHREFQSKGYSPTKFRKALVSVGQQWTFEWAIAPAVCSQEYIEICETALIQYLDPVYNVDKNPYLSSVKYERYEKAV